MSTISLNPNLLSGKNYIIFPESPFLLASLVVSIVATAKSFSALPLGVSTPLVMGKDFFPALLYNKATGELGEGVYGALSFVDPVLAGTLTYSFSALDTLYNASSLQIATAVADNSFDPLTERWEDFALSIAIFPHTNLTYNATVQVGIAAVDSALTNLETESTAAASAKSIFDFTAHVGNTNNPHNDTADDIGLGHVPNWSTGGSASIIAGGSETEFTTPLSIKDSVSIVVPQATLERRGMLQLNVGTSPNDNVNNVDGLTAEGLVYMLSHGLMSSGAALVDNQRHKVQFSPHPITYPATWHGHVCDTFEQLVQAVMSETGISELTAYAHDAAIYFPHTASVPDLTLS
jgi:hypothetical protein